MRLAVKILLEKSPSDRRLFHSLDFLTYVIGRQAKLLESLQWYLFIASNPPFNSDTYLMSSSLNNLGFSFKSRSEHLAEAEMCFLGAWELIKSDPQRITQQPRFLEDLAFYYRDSDRWQLSEQMFRKLVELRNNIACAKCDLARSHTDLSFVLDKLGKQNMAEEHFSQAIKVLESDPKIDPGQLAQQIEYLAFFYKKNEKMAKAAPLFERASAIRKGLNK